MNEDTIIQIIFLISRLYCSTVVNRLGDRVKRWLIFNEPAVFTFLAYLSGLHPPGVRDPRIAVRSTHITNLAQWLAARAIRATGKAEGICTAFSMTGIYPATDSAEDKAAAERRFAFTNLWFLEPAAHGRYPDAYVGGMDPERLGVLPGDMEIVKTDFDFIGINLYSRAVVQNDAQDANLGAREVAPPDAERCKFGWEVYPEAIHDVIVRIWRDYKKPIYITENGASYDDVVDERGRVNDPQRVSFYQRYVAQVGRAIEGGAG